MKIFAFAVIVLLLFAAPGIGEEKREDDGLFSNGSFLSEAVSSATNKINKVASGQEGIVSDDAKGIPRDTLEYDGDALGRPLPKPRRADFRNSGSQ